MRIIVKQYANGKHHLVETNDDATSIIKQEGKREPGKRISAFIEVSADDNEKGMSRVLEAMRLIEADVERRKQDFGKAADKKERK